MGDAVLVTYATIHGSTREVAERVAETLRVQGLAVDLQEAKRVGSLDPYRAVVLGAPLYMFHWHKDARGFLARHRRALAQKPIAIFVLGPLNQVEKEFQGAREQMDKELAGFPWLQPVCVEIMGGKLDPAHFRFPYNLIPAMNKMPPSDIRDWDAIKAFASGLAAKLQAG